MCLSSTCGIALEKTAIFGTSQVSVSRLNGIATQKAFLPSQISSTPSKIPVSKPSIDPHPNPIIPPFPQLHSSTVPSSQRYPIKTSTSPTSPLSATTSLFKSPRSRKQSLSPPPPPLTTFQSTSTTHPTPSPPTTTPTSPPAKSPTTAFKSATISPYLPGESFAFLHTSTQTHRTRSPLLALASPFEDPWKDISPGEEFGVQL
ncbi:hypothetical protein WAI453_002973 [Rhynchosporium graminicola]